MTTPKNINIWDFFDAISKIPRISKHEEKIVAWLVEFGKEHHLETHIDTVGNVLIRKNATTGFEKRQPVILQSHLDMVAAKAPSSNHDFLQDPVSWYKDGNWIRSRGTTLGADDGIGVAAALTVLTDDTLEHGPLECLFTVDEESGMTGAKNLRNDWLKGKILINLDSEDEGELFIGCAGGLDTTAFFKPETTMLPEEYAGFTLTLNGLTGGHSGDEIHKGHANAIKLMTRFLWHADKMFGIYLSGFEGGTLRNAIPPEAEASFFLHKKDTETFKEWVDVFTRTLRAEYHATDPGMKFNLSETLLPEKILSDDLKRRLILSLYACPHGVYSWSRTIPGLVETSANLALLRMAEGEDIMVGTNQRSAVESAKTDVSDMVASVFLLAGAEVRQDGNYPGWEPNPDSEILKITSEAYRNLFGQEPAMKAIHAGLECGLFLEKYPALDMISFGPTIRGAHTPEERLDIESTGKFWKLLTTVLRNIPEC
ncbi:MAG: aminoacyl-histidine dipeptidase [Chlorobi bacterium]|nr:aminoacyl-histidine dipeptidase [Chlorobiota bacterium]